MNPEINLTVITPKLKLVKAIYMLVYRRKMLNFTIKHNVLLK